MRCSIFLLFTVGVFLSGCAGQECDFHSECGDGWHCTRGRCLRDCIEDFDCDPGQMCNEIGECVMATDAERPRDAGPIDRDGGPITIDAGPRDAGPRIDAGIDAGPRTDAGPRIDAGPLPGTGRYLDRCAGDGDCATGHCVDDVGGTRMCTIECASHRDCAGEHVCASGLCRPDDTGIACSTTSSGSCVLGLCVGNATTEVGHCTRECSSASDCPAGYACADAGGTRVCVDIEKSCSDPSQCATGLCLSVQGCTAECRTAADCPRRFDFLPQYTCAIAYGSARPICVPPEDIVGADPIGASCRTDASGTFYLCRSGACDDAAPTGPMCTQSCSEEGGCARGLGCFPLVEGGEIIPACSRAGSRAIGASCTSARECASGLCDSDGRYCTRLCTDDALCPSDMRCENIPGFSIALCRR